MNTRVQVEHCVTEMVTGIDIVKEGIRVAAGEPLSVVPGRRRAARARDRVPDQRRGRRQELRPRAGHDRRATASPPGPGVRVDSGVGPGSEISPMYDPMVAKLIVWDVDREQATQRMLRALGEYEIEGLKTLLPFHQAILQTAPVGRRRDLPRPDRGPRVAQDARLPAAPKPRRGAEEGETVEHELHGRGLRQALRRQGDRPAVRRRRRDGGSTRPAAGARRDAPRAAAQRPRRAAAAAAAATRCPRRFRAPC